VDDYATFSAEITARNVFLRAHHCGYRDCEEIINQETKATARCIPLDAPAEDGMCVRCDRPGLGKRLIFAKAY
jgi:prolyl-tRNA synthetase